MCGLAGIFYSEGPVPIDVGCLRRMTNRLAHRGPDGDGFHIEPGLGLGHRRLAVVDIAGGQQPMYNEDGSVVIVFNGMIYNHATLREQLQQAGHVFRSRCDTETILHAWESWGPECLGHLSGMFAFALWDRHRQMLFLARDRVGKKPLHYRFLPDGGLVFASEINALLEGADGALPLDALAVDDFFAYGYIPEPRSIYRDIRKIPAAHYLLQERGRAQAAQPRRYWHAAPILSAEPDAVSTLQLHLRRSVADRLTADVPLGAFLSGGVDSGAIVATAAGLRAAPLATFTIGFEGPEDERDLAAQVAARYATSHHAALAVFDPLEAARRQAALFGEPFGDMSSVPTEAVCALARRHVTVALSGDGGDEVLGGYRRYQWHMIAQAVRACIPSPLRRSVLGRLARAYPKLDWAPRWLRAKHTLTEMSLDSALGYYSTLCKAQFERRRGLFTPALTSRLDGYDPGARVVEIMAESDEADSLRQAQMVDLALYLPGDILTKVDRTSMAHGLEVRAPLLDTDFVLWGLGLPSALKMRGGQGKRVLKQAMAVQLPREILYRAKQGFAASPAGALRAAASTLRARLLGESMLDSGLFQRRGLGAVIEQHVTGGFDHSQILWSLLVFQGFLAGAARAPESAQKFLNPVLSGS